MKKLIVLTLLIFASLVFTNTYTSATIECETDTDCDNNLYCDGQETCVDTVCLAGISVDCTSWDLHEIQTCNYCPDDNPYTWDYFPGYTSVCHEDLDMCTEGEIDLTHTCDVYTCDAECDSDDDCEDADPTTIDVCNVGCECDYTYIGYCGDGYVRFDEECEMDEHCGINGVCMNDCICCWQVGQWVACPVKISEFSEGDLVNIELIVYGPEPHSLMFTYSYPFNENGEWQTNYNDAGIYDIEIIITDGSETATDTSTIIVENKARGDSSPIFMRNKATNILNQILGY